MKRDSKFELIGLQELKIRNVHLAQELEAAKRNATNERTHYNRVRNSLRSCEQTLDSTNNQLGEAKVALGNRTFCCQQKKEMAAELESYYQKELDRFGYSDKLLESGRIGVAVKKNGKVGAVLLSLIIGALLLGLLAGFGISWIYVRCRNKNKPIEEIELNNLQAENNNG